MKIKGFFGGIFFSAMLLCSEGVMGQTLTEVTEDNYGDWDLTEETVGFWVLDCSKIEADRLASTSITGSDDLYTHNETEETNKVWKKLLIANSEMDGNLSGEWVDASSNIGLYDIYGYSDWRLPTQRELMVMYAMAVDDMFESSNYWAATYVNSDNAWCVNFSNGCTEPIPVSSSDGTYTALSRIVRELD